MAGDKYAKAKALSKLLEEFTNIHGGDKERGKQDMDDKVGPAWQVEVVVDDIGPEIIPEDVILDTTSATPDDKDEMLKNARKHAKEFGMRDDDLTNEGSDRYEDSDSKSDKSGKPCLSTMLRELADELEKAGE